MGTAASIDHFHSHLVGELLKLNLMSEKERERERERDASF